MRIAVNSRLLIPGKMDGIGRFTYESFKRIAEKHPEVEFTFIVDRKSALKAIPVSAGKGKVLSPPARHPILWYLWFEHRLRNYLNREKFDLFVSPEGWIPARLNVKSLAVIHDLNFFHYPENIVYSHRKFLRHYFPKYVKRADRIATVSEFSKQDLVKTLEANPDKIDLVFNGVSEVFQPLAESEQLKIREKYSSAKPYFIFVGTLHPRKNLEHLFQAFEHFKSKFGGEEKLIVVGNRKWWPRKLEILISSMKYAGDLHFLGRVEDQLLSKLIASSLALTYLPYFEGFGIPILEAFGCKTPVITAKNSSLPEVGGEAALLCDAKDVESIAVAMERIRSDSELRTSLIGKGQDQLKQFSWDKTADRLWSSMKKCLVDKS